MTLRRHSTPFAVKQAEQEVTTKTAHNERRHIPFAADCGALNKGPVGRGYGRDGRRYGLRYMHWH